jgi:hypothetical protein
MPEEKAGPTQVILLKNDKTTVEFTLKEGKESYFKNICCNCGATHRVFMKPDFKAMTLAVRWLLIKKGKPIVKKIDY